jgi:succinate dehydrogenase / fumarate reductase cytochrome b subunit
MERLRELVASSIGKKELMAATGLAFIGFLIIHLAGNLSIYGGGDAFNAYADKLHSLGPLIELAELGLLAVGLVHIGFASIIMVENISARPKRYAVKGGEGGRTLASRTMLLSGPYILLFVVFHLLHFTLIDKGGQTIAEIVSARFHDPVWVAFYCCSMLVVGLHISHGFWSGFQTLGLETLRRGGLRKLALVAGVVFALGFSSLPIAVYTISDLLR